MTRKVWQAAAMRRPQIKLTLKLRLLALVLALALVWYSLNPAPTLIIHRQRDDELPEEKKREVDLRRMAATLPGGFRPILEISERLSSPDEDEDDFEWPEFIDG